MLKLSKKIMSLVVLTTITSSLLAVNASAEVNTGKVTRDSVKIQERLNIRQIKNQV